MYIVTSAQMRELDRYTIQDIGIPALALMESAGKAIAEEIIRFCQNRRLEHSHDTNGKLTDNHVLSSRVRLDRMFELPNVDQEHWLILVGKGNNGGDGLVAARYLREAGLGVTIMYAESPHTLQGEAAIQRDAAAALGIPRLVYGVDQVDYESYTGILDALLGTGALGAPRAAYAEVIAAANDSGRPIVSADIPSGLNADTGEMYAPCIAARVTVCLAFLKRGLVQFPGAGAAGELVVRSIGIPADRCAGEQGICHLLTENVLRSRLHVDPTRRRDPNGHKGTYGHVLLAAGSYPMSGAGLLASRAALRAGSGLVTWALPGNVLPHMMGAAPEVMLAAAAAADWDAASAEQLLQLAASRDVLAVGPGLGRFVGDGRWIQRLWEDAACPLVVDADALNMLAAAGDFTSWKSRAADTVLTPHPGEMARLAGLSTQEVERDRMGLAISYASSHRVTLVLKGARTVIAAPDGSAYVNMTGHPGMATGGAGDVLTGIIAGLLAQGHSGIQAATFGVYLHGLAGDAAAAHRGHPSSLAAGDIIEAL
ncbi:bifunctional ADP-dependent NAD(P)H-hydrate dehydratase/NAD(P)H-hydrate epimerase [Paenibacillus pini]|uniref:Bifunctional NAD(P)H-hydrate repair enzyme n=1 Tax=Paenibacillus pini JCM 16418 TaxID=1236976 RepID=W7YPA3_9BACL|nr:bifunctional ADP-dependent NAD(P)H-hydrate dehydratase/NAD(P)H-hydrate epimerase [Paenibacillus pini]GAF09448.1 NAD(P)HX epimerase [Paenibacillus pini JCM 16418]